MRRSISPPQENASRQSASEPGAPAFQVTAELSTLVTYAVAKAIETAYASRHHSDTPTTIVALLIRRGGRGHRRAERRRTKDPLHAIFDVAEGDCAEDAKHHGWVSMGQSAELRALRD